MRVPSSLALKAANERTIVSAFRAERAVSGSSARRLAELNLKLSRSLQDLIGASIVRKAGSERYYLDESVWATRRRLNGRGLARVAVVAALALIATLLFLSR